MGEKVKIKTIFLIIFNFTLFIFFMYIFIAKIPISQILTFRSGPINRIFLGQIVGLFLHLDIFPSRISFLKGASFPKIISEKILGLKNIRSARVVMEVVNPRGIEQNTAGVMNTIFVAEAYANYGVIGIIVSILYVSFIIDLFFIIFMKLPKNPLTVALLSYFTVSFSITLFGGFVDYVYNAVTICLFLTVIFIYMVSHIIHRIKEN